MKKHEPVKVGKVTVKKLGDRTLGCGCSRKAWKCDYKKDGVEYILKEAHTEAGVVENRFEYLIATFGIKSEYAPYIPRVAAISRNGRYMLVERCVTRSRSKREYEDCDDVFPQSLLEVVNDLHGGNWGYSKADGRPVIFDMGLSGESMSDVAAEVGVPGRKIEKLLESEYCNVKKY